MSTPDLAVLLRTCLPPTRANQQVPAAPPSEIAQRAGAPTVRRQNKAKSPKSHRRSRLPTLASLVDKQTAPAQNQQRQPSWASLPPPNRHTRRDLAGESGAQKPKKVANGAASSRGLTCAGNVATLWIRGESTFPRSGWYRIAAAATKGVATEEAPGCQAEGPQQAMVLQRRRGIVRAARLKPARRRQEARKRSLIEANQREKRQRQPEIDAAQSPKTGGAKVHRVRRGRGHHGGDSN